MSELLEKWKQGLLRTQRVTFNQISTLFGTNQINCDLWDELETILLQADIGINITNKIINNLQYHVKREGITDPLELNILLKTQLRSFIQEHRPINFDINKPFVIMIAGVNGSGKTTTIAKLGNIFLQKKKKVIIAAADTFRTAANEQLMVWGNRLNIPVIGGNVGSDPGAVAYDAVESAKSKNVDVVLVDTAGRLHTRYNLMEELRKVQRVIGKALPGAPHEVWLVLDATTGQNSLIQAKSFKETVNVTGIIIAKLDTSAKGGMVFAIQEELQIPIIYAGLGENVDDLNEFDKDSFIESIIAN